MKALILLLFIVCSMNNTYVMIENTFVDEFVVLQCFMCNETIPDGHSYFKYTSDYLICIHCYFYKTSFLDSNPAPEYICRNGLDIPK